MVGRLSESSDSRGPRADAGTGLTIRPCISRQPDRSAGARRITLRPSGAELSPLPIWAEDLVRAEPGLVGHRAAAGDVIAEVDVRPPLGRGPAEDAQHVE